MRIIFIFLIVIFNFSFLIFHLDKAEASALSLSIDPPIIAVNALPPSTATSNLTVQNKSDSELNLKIELRPFKAKGENGELEFLETASTEYANKALFLKNIEILENGVVIKTLTLGPKQEKKLDINITIPEDSSISDYYFSIVFISDNNASPTSNATLNELGIATNVLLSIGAKETPDAVITDFSTGLFFESGPVPFTLRVKNKGSHFIKPKGEILIKNMFGQSIGKLDILRSNILSSSTRALANAAYLQDLRSQEALGEKTKSDLNFQNPKVLWKEGFLLGFYTASLALSLSNDGPVFVKQIHFFAFPFQGLIIIVIALIAFIVIRNRIKAYMQK